MNIFATSQCPVTSAYNLPHSHVVSQVKEAMQLLSTAHRILDNNQDERLSRISHKDNRFTKWTMACTDNYMWLYRHAEALAEVYESRNGKAHAGVEKRLHLLSEPPRAIPEWTFVYQDFQISDIDKDILDLNESVHVKYQHYLNAKYKMWIETENKSCKNLIWTVDYPHWLDNSVKEFAEKLLEDNQI